MNAPAKGISLASIIALIRKEIGDAGEIGPQGEQGAKGEKGLQGPQGNTGPAGKQGPKGKDGKQGKAGKDGKDGKDGDDGVGIKDISQDVDDAIVITMTDGETYEIELPLGPNTEVHYKTSGGGGSSGTVDLSPYVLRPTTKMSGWLAYREDGNKGEWTPVTTDLVTVNPNQFRDAKGKFAPTPKELEGIDNQRDVNEFLYGKIQEVGGEHEDFATKESLAKEAEMRREKDEFLQDQINNNQSQIDTIQEKGYDDTELRKEIADEVAAREKAVEAEKWERSLADIGLRDSLQSEIDILKQYSFSELDDKINIESETRRVADQGLQAEISSLAITLAEESSQRENADTELQGQIDSLEAYDDTEIKEELAAEIADREAGDADLQGQIDAISDYDDTEIREGLAAEISTRESEDKALQKQIETEKQERSLADIGLRDSLQANIDAIEIPSIEGLATEEYVDSAIEGIEFPETDLTGLATEEYVDGAVSSEADARREADRGIQSEVEDLAETVANLEIPSIDGLASEEWVTDQIDALEPYDDTDIKQALSAEADAREERDDDLQYQIDQISEKGYDDAEIREGLAKESEDRAEADLVLAKKIEDEKTERSLADIGLRDSLQANIDAIEIPSLDGYATEEYVDGAINAIEFPETDLSEYAKTEYVDGAVNSEAETRRVADEGLQEEINTLADTVANLDIPSIDGLATEEWVTGEIEAIEFPETDLTDYYTKGEVDESQQAQDLLITENKTAIGDEAQARTEADAALDAKIDAIEIPSLEGYATETYVDDAIGAIEFPETDLSEYAKTEYVDAGDSNLQEQINGIEIPSLEGYATEGWVTDQIDAIPETDLSDYYTKTEVDESQSIQDGKITANENKIATNANSIEVEAEAREQEDNHLQAEIDQIALALEALLVQREAGRWKYIGFSGDNIPRNPGEFSLLSDDLSSAENNITINQTDLGDTFHGFADVAVGDYVEIVDLDKPDEYALFVVDSEPDGTGIVSMNLKLKDKGNNFLVGTTCEIRFFQLNEQDLDLTELDARYLTKRGGKTDGILILGYDEEVTNNEAAAQIGFVKTHVDEAIQRIPPPDLSAYALTEYVDEADLDLQQQIDAIEIPSLGGYATEKYVDDAIDAIEFPETDLSDYYTKTEVNESQQAQDTLIASNTSSIEGEAQARADADTVLDAKIDAIEIPSLEGYATEEYVDTAIDGIEFPETDLTEYAKTTYVDTADALLQGQIDALEPYDDAGIKADLAQETEDRIEGDASLQSDVGLLKLELGAETASRIEGDLFLQEQIDELEPYDDAGIKQELADEVVAREAGDANLQGQIDAIEIPSLDGYATEEWVSGQIDAIPETDLTDYAKTEYVDAADRGLQDQLDALEIPSLEGYATEGYVDSAIDAIPETDLSAYAKTDYVDAADANLQSQIDAIDIPDIPDIPDLSDYVSAVDGEQSMKGPLEIHSLGAWKGSRLLIDHVTARSNTGSVTLGTMNNEKNLRVYDDKVQVTDVPLYVKNLKGFADGYGCNYVGAYDEPDHIATKKDVEAALAGGGGGGGDLSGLVQKSGDTMTGTLEAPRINVKKDGEAVSLIEGNVSNTNTAARLTFSNKYNSNAYASLEWHGSSGSNGWFQFTQTVDLNTKGLHSVNNIRLVGNKAIQEAQTTRIQLDGKVVIKKTGTNKAGFVLKGAVSGNSDGNLLSVWHNSSGLDSVDYYGRQDGDTHIATVGYVKANSGGGGGFTPGDQVAKTNGTSTNIGGFWISSGALYVKVS